ncbi:MAG TPA: BON domain-containing protein [Candidatus Dormibacteraeota bacterium]|nr:BON domain-containing protein [Candidatus Dormibacteraeota bacterium]
MADRVRTGAAPRADARWWLGAAAVAAAAAATVYWFDPASGRSRRARTAQQVGHVARAARARMAREIHYLCTTASGKALHHIAGDKPVALEGRALLDRVESELFTDPAIPHGALNFDVEGTTVVLRGQLPSQADIDRVKGAVKKVRGVAKVRSFLHLPGMPAPNKVSALLAGTAATRQDGWPEEPPPDVDSEA